MEAFEGMEPYYQRLFKQIKERQREQALGTGGDIQCLIAMVEYLWTKIVQLKGPHEEKG